MDGTDGLVKRRIAGQRFQIAGSADEFTQSSILSYAHSLIARMTYSLVSEGGRIVIQLGEEPQASEGNLATLFDWTMLEQVVRVSSEGTLPRESIQGTPCIAVGFSDWKSRIPHLRAPLVQRAIEDGILELVELPQTLHIGGVLRERQASYGDILVTLGGGPGVEHLAGLYKQMHKPAIPFDLPLKPGKTSASERLNTEARKEPSEFFEYQPSERATAALSNLSLVDLPQTDAAVRRFLDFVTSLTAPRVFFAHLLNKRLAGYRNVSSFFEQVVSQVMVESGFSRFDPEKDSSNEPFLNVEVFKMIQASSIVVVDLTVLRPNCFIELGFALGAGKKVITTAAYGTKLPFDTEALPCHFWRPRVRNATRQRTFREFVASNINRRKLIEP